MFILFKRRRKMSSVSDKVVELVVAWFIVFAGVFPSPDFFPFSKIVIMTLTTVVLFVVGYAYYRHSQPKRPTHFIPVTSVSTTRSKILHVLGISIQVVEIVFVFYIAIAGWKVYAIEGVSLITYENLFLIGMFFAGIYLSRDLGIRFREYRNQKNKN